EKSFPQQPPPADSPFWFCQPMGLSLERTGRMIKQLNCVSTFSIVRESVPVQDGVMHESGTRSTLKRVFLVALLFVLLVASSSLLAATLGISASAPTPGANDIYNFLGAGFDADSVGAAASRI